MMKDREKFTEILTEIAGKPLKLAPNFPEIAERWERWWNFDADRPLIIAQSLDDKSIYRGKCFHLLDNPAEYLKMREAQTYNTFYCGEAIPSLRVDLGPVATAALLGLPVHFSEKEMTSWQDPNLADWAEGKFDLDENFPLYKQVVELARMVAKAAKGNYVVCLPDLAGGIDVLANMRGPDVLCFDLFENPDQIKENAMKVVHSWEKIFTKLYEVIVAENGAGCIQWVGNWSNSPYTIPTNDFNYLIGSDHYEEFCLPSVIEQSRFAGRCCLHVDGPGAAKHAKYYAEVPELTAIQFTPGEGTKSTANWYDMFKLIQDAGKPMVIITPPEEIEELCKHVDPRGTAILPLTVADKRQAEWMLETVKKFSVK